MNVLVIGRGGRENSIVSHVAKSKRVKHIYAAPGNAGMAKHAECININELATDELVQFAKEKQVDLTIVGPEMPLNEGIANRFAEEGLRIFAPTKEAALLEGSKSFAKDFMKKYDIPTATYATFTNAEEAKQYIKENDAPIVVKADGLAEGKGVVVAETTEEALQAVEDMMINKSFAEAGATIVIEEFLEGEEFSLMAFVNGSNVYPMVPARDHKRAFDNDEGPNTGGMGAYAPVPDVSEADLTFTTKEVIQKAANSLIAEGRPFTGVLYAGLMMTEAGPKVIEFNTRLGDPETQVVLPLLKNDFIQVLLDVLEGNDPLLQWEDKACVGVVVASKGYPETSTTGVPIPLMKPVNDCFVIQAGTKQAKEGLVSAGGRVLLVGAVDENLPGAADLAYTYLQRFDQENRLFYRTDIGKN